jgi:hypothetical protein
MALAPPTPAKPVAILTDEAARKLTHQILDSIGIEHCHPNAGHTLLAQMIIAIMPRAEDSKTTLNDRLDAAYAALDEIFHSAERDSTRALNRYVAKLERRIERKSK